MAEITISGKKALNTISREFQAQFPYLRLAFFTREEWERAQKGEPVVRPIDMTQRLAAVRTTIPAKDEKDLSIHGRTLVKNLENNFLKTYGLCVQVCYSKGGQGYYTSGSNDEMSLTQLNAQLERDGYDKKPK